jgi:aspartate aminotransferase
VQERQLVPLCILAFQGLASGDPAKDAQPMRFMVHEGLPVVLVQSFDAVGYVMHRGFEIL